jgi:hypothetical protein
MANRRWTSLVAASAVLGGSGAFAHDWVIQGDPERHADAREPNPQETADGFTSVYEVHVERGQPLALVIRDTQSCDASIRLTQVVGNSAKLKAKVDAPLVRNQIITIKGRRPGVTTAVIPVVGKDVGGSGNCKENSKNLLVVTVSESPAVAERGLETSITSEMDRLRSLVASDLREQRTVVDESVRDLGDGALDPPEAWIYLRSDTTFRQRELVAFLGTIEETVRTDARAILGEGLFVAGCEPTGFTASGFGPMARLIRDEGRLSVDYTNGLASNLFRAADRIDVLADSSNGLFFNAQLFPPVLPASAPPVLGSTPLDPPAPLQFHFGSGASWLQDGSPGAGIYVSGGYGLGKSAPTLTFTAPDGGTTVVSASNGTAAPGARMNFFDGFVDTSPGNAGSAIRVDATYPGESSGPSFFITVPKIPPGLPAPR